MSIYSKLLIVLFFLFIVLTRHPSQRLRTARMGMKETLWVAERLTTHGLALEAVDNP